MGVRNRYFFGFLGLLSLALISSKAQARKDFCDQQSDHLYHCQFNSSSETDYAAGELCDFPVQEFDNFYDNDVVHLPEGEAPAGGHHLSSVQGTLVNPSNGKTVKYHGAAGFSIRDMTMDLADDCNGTISYTFILTGQNVGLTIPGQGLVDAFIGRQEFKRSLTLQDCEVVSFSNDLVSQSGQWEANPGDVDAICSYLAGK